MLGLGIQVLRYFQTRRDAYMVGGFFMSDLLTHAVASGAVFLSVATATLIAVPALVRARHVRASRARHPRQTLHNIRF